MPGWVDNSSKLVTVLTNSIEGNSLSLIMQQTVQGGCQTKDGCQSALVGNALRGDLLGLEDWASITSVIAEPPTCDIALTEENTVHMKCSEGMLTFQGEPPGPELFKVTVDNGGGPVDLQDIRVAKIDLAAQILANSDRGAEAARARRLLARRMSAEPTLTRTENDDGSEEYLFELGMDPPPQGGEKIHFEIPAASLVGVKGGLFGGVSSDGVALDLVPPMLLTYLITQADADACLPGTMCVLPDDLAGAPVKADALLQIKHEVPQRVNGMPSKDQTEERENRTEAFIEKKEKRDASLEPAYKALAEAREDLEMAAEKIGKLTRGKEMMAQEALDEEEADAPPQKKNKVKSTLVQYSASESAQTDNDVTADQGSAVWPWRSWLGKLFGAGGEETSAESGGNTSVSALEEEEKQGPLGGVMGGALGLEDLTTPPPPVAVAEEPAGPWNGATAPFSEKGFSALTMLCCSFEAEVYLRRLVHQERLQVCNEGGLSGMLPYLTCAPNKTLAATKADIQSFTGIKCAVFAKKGDHASCTWPPECDANNTGSFNPAWHRRRNCKTR